MTSSYPAALPLLLGIVVAAVTAFGLIGYGFPAIGRGGQGAVARGGAALAGALTVVAYAWGLVSLFLDESGTAQACQEANPSLYGQVSGYSVSYLPPALNCRLTSGGSYTAAVPDFLTPVMTGCAVIAVTLALIAVAEHHRTTRPEHPEKRNT
jgi:xanthine/uracil permease